MQQTRIEQGTAYYLKFVEKYPTVHDLASAPLDDVMLLWEGLGYYTRARNLHKAAQQIVEHHHALLPSTYAGLLSLPGIGPYSAAAIASFAYDLPHVVVDGNVKRLISRYAGIKEVIDLPATHNRIHAIASDLLGDNPAAIFNQAIMNFGALICKPKPLCAICPLSSGCFAYKHNIQLKLPLKTKKKPNTLRHFHFVVLHHRNKILFMRRDEQDIWQGLYTPPVIEKNSTRVPQHNQLLQFIEQQIGHFEIEYVSSSGVNEQLLSHQTIVARHHHFKLKLAPKKVGKNFVWAHKASIQTISKPRSVVNVIDDYALMNI